MERYKSRLIDELYRIIIPGELIKELSINAMDKVSFTAISTIVILQKTEDNAEDGNFVCEVTEHGMVTLPQKLRSQMGWDVNDALSIYYTDKLMILKSPTKSTKKELAVA